MANMENIEIGRDQAGIGWPAAELERHFGLVMALGVLLMLMGAFALFADVIATLASVMFFGTLLIIGGITQTTLAFSSRHFHGVALHLMLGVASFVAGLLFVRAPLMGASAITLVVASWLLVSGIGQTVHALVERPHHWGFQMFSGLIGALLGTLLLATWPVASLWFVGINMGIQFVVQGISWMSLAFTAHREVAHMHPAH